MPFFKVSVTNCIIQAKDKDQACQGFANYMNELDNSCFQVETIPAPTKEDIEDGIGIDWIEES